MAMLSMVAYGLTNHAGRIAIASLITDFIVLAVLMKITMFEPTCPLFRVKYS